jgi:NADH-quinone oxidoreductase subunit L
MVAAFLTAYYMFRLLLLTFYGKFRGTHEQEHHLHESPVLITVPLIILAILSIVGGAIGIPHIFGHHWLQGFLEPILAASNSAHEAAGLSQQSELMLMGIATVIAVLGIIMAIIYHKNYNAAKQATGFASVLENKWYFDEAYDNAIVKPVLNTSSVLNSTIEPKGIDGLVNSVGTTLQKASGKFRLLQSGMVGFYMFIMVAGVLLLFSLLFFIK